MTTTDWVISTNLARCRDCYRCVRVCPVKAVRVQNGQAQIVPKLCIACASCERACPQGAKSVRDDRPAVKRAITAGKTVVASVAPSAPAFFNLTNFAQMEAVLRELGFSAAGETAYGAEMIGKAHKDVGEAQPERRPLIASSCPVVVNLIERYYPDLIPHLAPLVSPMIAHARWLHQKYGENAYLVFIGPCIAKKAEILDEPVADVVDAALTFKELQEWMEARDIQLPEPTSAGEKQPQSPARLFPVEGGLVGTAKLDTSTLAQAILTTSGIDACQDVLRSIRVGELDADLVELMACEGGCINGPAMEGRCGVFLARQRVMTYATQRQPQPLPGPDDWPDLTRTFSDKSVPEPEFSEEQIRQVLRRVDKYSPADELNCCACGYPSCRDKAIATLRGMAEATMCIPYMRRRAESLRQVVMDVTPNAVLVVDKRLLIQDMSPSAETLFNCRLVNVIGQPLSSIMQGTSSFEHVRDTGKPILSDTVRVRDDLILEQTIVPVEGQNLLVGILRDVTERIQQKEQLEHLRSETLQRTQEVVKNQMRVAHEIAQLLGETTAETKMMLAKLARLLEEGGVS